MKKFLSMEDIEFRQWCLEQAIKWPREFAQGGGMLSSGYTPAHDVDLITRAKTIHDWVKGISK